MKIAKYTLIDCATGLPHGSFELLDQARHRVEVGNLAKWEIINGTVISRESSSAAVERVPQMQPGSVPQQTIPPEVLNGMLGMVFRGLRR